ncbi:hypothetical protein Tco_1042765 [Tanacetum coccineum]|uniref:MAK10-like protein n=1 Tax=Tanacetum coccineum TaxID=301880 RepID=A0ABQ5GK37_9ASTR
MKVKDCNGRITCERLDHQVKQCSIVPGDENPIRTLGDYSKPSHEGYRNTIELPVGNNVVPLRSDNIRRTAKLRNDILIFQQHHGESLSEAWTHFKDLLQKFPHHGIELWLQVQIFYDHVNPVTRRTIDQSAGGKPRDRNAKESWALLEDLAIHDNESWNDLRDLAKPVKAIALPQDVSSTSDHHLIELEKQVQRLMEAHLDPTQPTQVNKITTSCEICSGLHDTQYYMEDLEQAFVEYASSRTDEMGGSTRFHRKVEVGVVHIIIAGTCPEEPAMIIGKSDQILVSGRVGRYHRSSGYDSQRVHEVSTDCSINN